MSQNTDILPNHSYLISHPNGTTEIAPVDIEEFKAPAGTEIADEFLCVDISCRMSGKADSEIELYLNAGQQHCYNAVDSLSDVTMVYSPEKCLQKLKEFFVRLRDGQYTDLIFCYDHAGNETEIPTEDYELNSIALYHKKGGKWLARVKARNHLLWGSEDEYIDREYDNFKDAVSFIIEEIGKAVVP